MYATLNMRQAFERIDIGSLDEEPDAIEFQGEKSFRENVVTLRAMSISDKLALLTDNEKEFLQLFRLDYLPMKADNPVTRLSRDVYRAADALVSSRILNRANVRDGVIRYCLPRETRRVWPFPEGFKKDCIEIHLDAVEGTGASGGGASGSR
jgi:hypothetical protein